MSKEKKCPKFKRGDLTEFILRIILGSQKTMTSWEIKDKLNEEYKKDFPQNTIQHHLTFLTKWTVLLTEYSPRTCSIHRDGKTWATYHINKNLVGTTMDWAFLEKEMNLGYQKRFRASASRALFEELIASCYIHNANKEDKISGLEQKIQSIKRIIEDDVKKYY